MFAPGMNLLIFSLKHGLTYGESITSICMCEDCFY